jgi:predicted MFS family arabinose efflux permease/pimeloyl-ACP methyl ester carboxylesterase
LLVLLAVIDSQVIGAVAPQIAAGLGVTKTAVAGSITLYSLAAASVALWLGKYARRMNPSVWLPLSAALFVAASVLAAAAPHLAFFLAARALAGLAGGLISALSIAAIANASSYAKRGRQMSGVAVSYFLAPVLGVPLGALLTGAYGWRAVFALAAVLVAVACALVYLFPLPSATPEASGADDRSDAVQQAAGSSAWGALWKLLVRSRSTLMGVVGAFFVSGGLVGFTAYLGTWLSDAFYAGPRDVGLVYALAGLGAVVGGGAGGALADRFGKRRVAIQGSLWMALLLVMLPAFAWSASLLALIGLTAFLAALRVAPLQALITELVDPSERATYVALRNGASQLGIAGAVAGCGRLYATLGLAGVGLLCAALTLGAWLSVRMIHDPHRHSAPEMAPLPAPGVERKGRRFARRIGVVALAMVLVVCVGLPWLLSFAITKARTRPIERARTDTPAAQGAAFEDVTFKSADGNQLLGWYLPSRTKRVTIIMSHGLFRSRYEMLDRGVALWTRGYGILLYDLRRHGQSPAEFSTLGFNERHDVLGAVDFMRRRAPQDKIVLMGVSMGAAATLLAAAEDKDIMAVIADSSFLSFSDTVYHHLALARIPTYPFGALLVWFTAWRMHFAPKEFDVRDAVRRVKAPILFIGGSEDRRMPVETVLEPLYAAAPNPRKKKLIISGATHGNAYQAAPETYTQVVSDFLQSVALPDTANS